jgi:hypothetical protein
LLARVLATDALEDLGTTGVLIDERAHGVDTAIDDDVEALLDARVLSDLAGGKLLRHGALDAREQCQPSACEL